jgi:hypothetical protein
MDNVQVRVNQVSMLIFRRIFFVERNIKRNQNLANNYFLIKVIFEDYCVARELVQQVISGAERGKNEEIMMDRQERWMPFAQM